jgi:hypothetical protein
MNQLIYELKPLILLIIGVIVSLHAFSLLQFSGVILLITGGYIFGMRNVYRKMKPRRGLNVRSKI